MGRYDHTTGESKDERYTSLQRLLKHAGTMPRVRQFLWDEIGLKSLFTGTGRTMDECGVLGPPEFLCRNVPLAEIHGLVISEVFPKA